MNASGQRRWLVIGCGSIGRRHIGNLLALNAGEVIGCDTRPERRAETTSQHGVTCVASLDEAWGLRPEVALITTPTSLHLRLAIAAAERSCHLFIEKPLADQWDGTEQLVQLVREKHLVTLVGCNMRFHPGLRAVQRLLTEGAVGRVTAARFEMGQHLPDWHPQEDYRQNYSARRDLGGGVILDAIHELDYARWLLGEVSAVTCFAGKTSSLEIETEDTAEILLRFTSGAIGGVHLDYVQRAHRRTCQIIGEEGTIHWDYGAGRVNWFSARTRSWSELLNPPGWQPNQMYVDEMRHFIACLDGKAASQLDVSQARRVLQIALAAKEASATGQTVTWGNA